MATVITLASDILLGNFAISLRNYDVEEVSPLTGHSDVNVFGHPRWAAVIQPMSGLEKRFAAAWEVLALQFRGKRNVVALWDVVKPEPLGTLRTNPTLVSAASRSATLACGAGNAGKTLLAGDWIQLGDGLGVSQLVKLTEASTANGSGQMTVAFEPYLRISLTGGLPCRVIRPVAYYGLEEQAPGWSYAGHLQNIDQIKLLERFS